MNKKITLTIVSVLVIVLGIIGYSANQGLFDNSNNETNVDENTLEPLEVSEPELETSIQSELDTPVVFSLGQTNFEKLSVGHYEGWAVSGSDKISFGKFNIDDNGKFINLDGSAVLNNELEADLDDKTIDKLVITIEPEGDTDNKPTSVVAAELAGQSGGKLSFAAVDLSGAKGQYILGTPSDDPEGNENSGLWFAIPGIPPKAALTLPSLPKGWAYEGWAVFEGNVLTTGRFLEAGSGDSFSGFNGPGKIPNLPGEDFLQNLPNGLTAPIDLANGTSKAVLTLEPDIDGVDPTGDSPSQIKFLKADIPAGLVDHTLADLTLDTSSLPFIEISVK